jgi:hypothetical protein
MIVVDTSAIVAPAPYSPQRRAWSSMAGAVNARSFF